MHHLTHLDGRCRPPRSGETMGNMNRTLVAFSIGVSSAALVAAGVVLVPTAASAQPVASVPAPRALPGVALTVVPSVSGFDDPTAVASAHDGRGRLFVAERSGRIRIVKSGKVYKKAYLNLAGVIGSNGGEQGLLGLAFSPGFSKNGKLFVTYTARDGAVILASAKAKKASKNVVKKSTLKTILRVPHSFATNHNGGSLAFGTDGLLYFGTGDGGGSGDPQRTAQRLTSPLGKILRLNVATSCGNKRYCVPTANQFAKSKSKTKRLVFASGVRNPWRISIDSATGNLWVGDVGQDAFEEVNVVSTSARGVNFGWSCREANVTFNGSQCPGLAGYVAPVTTLCHPEAVSGCVPPFVGESIIGGYVYRGRTSPALVGTYIFADFMTGRIFGFQSGQTRQLASLGRITSFGESDSRELYAVTYGGTLYRIRSN
mgnify:FL=1